VHWCGRGNEINDVYEVTTAQSWDSRKFAEPYRCVVSALGLFCASFARTHRPKERRKQIASLPQRELLRHKSCSYR